LNWKKIETVLRKIVPESEGIDGDFYGWFTDKKPESIGKVAVVVDLLKNMNLSAYDLIISHHKPSFDSEFPIFVLHSPLDSINWGCHYQLAKIFGFEPVKKFDSGLGVYVKDIDIEGETLLSLTKKELSNSLAYFIPDRKIKQIAFFSGCGFNFPDFIQEAIEREIDFIISGDIVHHTAVLLKNRNIGFIDAGHYHTEIPGIKEFVRRLKKFIGNVEFIDGGAPYSYIRIG